MADRERHGSYRIRLGLPAHGAAVEISVKQGDLTVGQVPSARLSLTGAVRYSLFRPAVTWHASRSGVTVLSRCSYFLGACAFGYRVGLPADTHLVLSDNLGDFTITDVTITDVTAIDQSGDVTLTFATVPDHVRVSDQLGSVTLVLPPGTTTYRVRAHAGFGGTSIRVPSSSSSSHVIVVTDSSGSIEVTSATSPR
jgi:Putative adhesin